MKMQITVKAEINAPLEKVWNCWTQPEHITQWNFASDEWCCPKATNDLRPEGNFVWRMEARDGSMGFDFGGTYKEVVFQKLITILLGDGRWVNLQFSEEHGKVLLSETFETEDTHTAEQQRFGWQAILDNFKKHVESSS